jgi:hypothetical protein
LREDSILDISPQSSYPQINTDTDEEDGKANGKELARMPFVRQDRPALRVTVRWLSLAVGDG